MLFEKEKASSLKWFLIQAHFFKQLIFSLLITYLKQTKIEKLFCLKLLHPDIAR